MGKRNHGGGIQTGTLYVDKRTGVKVLDETGELAGDPLYKVVLQVRGSAPTGVAKHNLKNTKYV